MCGGRELRPRVAPRSWVGERDFGSLRGSLGVSCCAACGFVFVNPRPGAPLLEAFYGGPDYAFHDPCAIASGEPRGLEVRRSSDALAERWVTMAAAKQRAAR